MRTATELADTKLRETTNHALQLLRKWRMHHADALRLLADLPLPAANTPVSSAARYYAVSGLAHAQAGNDALALNDLRTALELGDAAWDGHPAMPPLIVFNTALVLLVSNTPRPYSVPDRIQLSNLHEAVSLFTGAAFQFNRTEQFRGCGGVALALLAETLFLLERNGEAVEAAERAVPLLSPHNGNQSRRLRGCYGIQKRLIPGWSPPAEYRTDSTNPPGTYNLEELSDYRGAW